MPKFQRISLAGSEELFRPTRVEQAHEDAALDVASGISPADALSGRVGEAEVMEEAAPEPVAEAVAPAAAPTPSPQAALRPGPITRPPLHHERLYHRVAFTSDQVKTVIEALQRMKYPHTVHTDQKPSMEEFEELDGLRKLLLDALE